MIHWKETVVGSFNTNLFHICKLICVTTGKSPQLGALDLQSPLQQRMHKPQRHRSEETDLQPTVLGTQNQRQEELQEELRTVVVTGPSLGPDHQEVCNLYFENTKRSGGGNIQEDGIRWDEKRMCFCITFQDSQIFYCLCPFLTQLNCFRIWKIVETPLFTFCGQKEETVDHLFWNCGGGVGGGLFPPVQGYWDNV